MINLIKNILTTTMLSLLGISLAGSLLGADVLYLSTVYELLLANALIHGALYFLHRASIRRLAIEIAREILIMGGIVLLCGALFHWYDSMPLPAVLIIILMVYIAAKIVDVARLRSNVDDINRQIAQNQSKEKDT